MTKTLQRLLGIGDWRETAVSQEAANRRNLRLLIQLRWLAVAGQVATILLVHFVMGIRVPVFWLLIAPAGLALVNLVSVPLTQRRDSISDQELMLALLADVAALTWQLFLTGGAANPFVALYLLQVVLGAVLLAPVYAWSLIGVTSLCFAALGVFNRPLNLPPDSEDALLSLYMQGSLICFLLMAVLLVLFMTRINDNLRARDAYVADVRQQATEQDHIVRMGLLASGAAHELGTPLASLSVILSDWRRMPMLKADADLKQDMDVMQAEVERCKAIVTGILMSAGEARGQAPTRTTMGRFLDEVVQGWSVRDARVRVEVTAWTGPDPSIIADPALRQVFGVLFDNAVEAGARRIFVSPVVRDGQLEFAIRDNGPGFPATILERLGKPYNSTKDRPGAGLGLFLLVNVMRSLGGAVEASNPPAGGGEVRLILPIAALAPQEMSDD
ncbi:ATP-binding protein [Brevundimonas mediterranea]|jgi:two-component system sensor histidine kinase RegB|uniref:histidine kinase n=1 Tax=Brevundimonas mediterranea TaxID=74329 RepID=A0A7W6EYZ3_9CAUL|nr:ATP-binding protein [Brevundimonas mediterranea]MBB3871284.1 two-component system sensor histidine kinase RegB [Brevundimonas mediterranea]